MTSSSSSSAGSPVLLVLVGLDVVEPPQSVAQVRWGRGLQDLEDRHVGLGRNEPEDRKVVTMVTTTALRASGPL